MTEAAKNFFLNFWYSVSQKLYLENILYREDMIFISNLLIFCNASGKSRVQLG